MLNHSELANFSGTSCYYRHGALRLTDGAKFIAENGGTGENGTAFWLFDVIDSLRFCPKVVREAFQVHKLTPNKKGSGAVFTTEDGNGNTVYRQRIPYVDFDFNGREAFTLWAVGGVVMLPSEY